MATWKQIPNTHYEVSSLGDVRHQKHKRVRRQRIKKDGYCLLNLRNIHTGKKESHRVHRLVAEAFLPNPESFPIVDHINHRRNDNRVDNLRWVTYSKNNQWDMKHRVSQALVEKIIEFYKLGFDAEEIRDRI